MLRPLGNSLASSVGRKFVMGATGLLLVGFLVEHLHGNLKLTPIPMLGDGEGRAFDEYVEFMEGLGIFKYLAEIALLGLFVCHVYIGLRLTMENREARKHGYAIRADRGAKTVGSTSMHLTGAAILLYLIKHLLDFRFNSDFHSSPASTVADVLSVPINGLIYIVASLVIGVHLSHGFRSTFQSLGISHRRWNHILKTTGIVLSIVFAIGFACIPVYFLFFHP